ncbi:hypothetical protein HK101_009272 [Irineochytrium annulatum]|nr:hypothetical protein HK101_009272 [Irineochytrium annulatum]
MDPKDDEKDFLIHLAMQHGLPATQLDLLPHLVRRLFPRSRSCSAMDLFDPVEMKRYINGVEVPMAPNELRDMPSYEMWAGTDGGLGWWLSFENVLEYAGWDDESIVEHYMEEETRAAEVAMTTETTTAPAKSKASRLLEQIIARSISLYEEEARPAGRGRVPIGADLLAPIPITPDSLVSKEEAAGEAPPPGDAKAKADAAAMPPPPPRSPSTTTSASSTSSIIAAVEDLSLTDDVFPMIGSPQRSDPAPVPTIAADGEGQAPDPSRKSRRKVPLEPGHSAMDWARLKATGGAELRGGVTSLQRYTPSQIREHKTREDCWMAIAGKVYDVTHYLKFHPGGQGQLMRGAGKDATELFFKVHPWVNHEYILGEKCLVGYLISEPK